MAREWERSEHHLRNHVARAAAAVAEMPLFTHRPATSVDLSGPPSPTLSAHTTTTNVGLSSAKLPAQLINRADLRNSLTAYETLLTASKAYTQALITLGAASSDLAVALESCSRLKGAHKVGSGLLASSGVHHMASNSWSILADTYWKDTSIPLMEHHDLYVQACGERTVQHEKAIVQKSKALNEAEKRNQKESRSKVGRDLVSFRKALLELQRHVDDLDEEKARYYADVLEGEEECWSFVQDKMIASMRNQLDMFERISSKGLSDPVLEPLLSSIADPFSAYGPPRGEGEIFSILDHGTLLGITPSPDMELATPNGMEKSGESPSSAVEPKGGLEHKSFTPANLIMSPSTPSKGLSRVASGAASPRLNTEPALNGPKQSNGLGISLTAAVELARNSASRSDVSAKKDEQQQQQQQSASASEQNNEHAELFGTDCEDDGGDEASIFSGTEDDLDGTATNGNSPDGQGAKQAPVGMAARIMHEKKRRRENAVRASAKTRLKHALSTIDESKGAHVLVNAMPAAAEDDEGGGEGKGNAAEKRSENGEINAESTADPDISAESHVKSSSSHHEHTNAQEHDVNSVWS